MKIVYIFLIGLVFVGCANLKTGDYVTYKSNDYLFVNDTFLSQSLDCLELGEIKQGGLDVKYCVGLNYASAVEQGFIFEHKYANFDERFVGSTLSFKTEDTFTIQCSSETIDEATSGTEYINCMVPKRYFDLYAFIIGSQDDINGQFKAAVGEKKVYDGAITSEGKKLLKSFYKALQTRDDSLWKKRSL